MSAFRQLILMLLCLLLCALPACLAEAPADGPQSPAGMPAERPGEAPGEKPEGTPGERPEEAPGERPEEAEAPAEGEAEAPAGSPTPLTENAVLEQIADGCLIVPIPTGEGWQSAQAEGCTRYLEKHGGTYMYQYKVLEPLEMSEAFAEGKVASYFEQISFGVSQLGGTAVMKQIEGYDVILYNVPNAVETRGEGRLGCVLYIRGNRQYIINYAVYPESLFVSAGVPDLGDTSDLEAIAAAMSYDENKSEIGLTITAEGSPAYITAGKKLTFTPVFNDPELVNARHGNEAVNWSVTDPEGKAVEGVTINKNGTLSAGKKVTENTPIVVHAESVSYLTHAQYALTVIPEVKGITAEPTELSFYLNSTEPLAVQAAVDPAGVPPEVLFWKSSSPKVAEVADQGEGKALVTPLSVGKATVTVSEPGGEKATVKVYVAQAVTEIELTYRGKSNPGASGTVKAAVLPKDATCRDVRWSLDVDENVATVSKNGTLKIGKDAAPGTVITVTCTAEGAPEPVVRTLQITVEK